ncbi:MAG TPA: hypothetical protein VGN12_19095 [Pirellulales bacterium]|jgi:hypothetical protein
MTHTTTPRRWFLLSLVAAFAGLGTATAAPRKVLPSLDQVEATVEGYFSQQARLQPGEIISRSQVRAVLDLLQRQGWKVPHQAELLERVLDDSDPLVRELRTKDGRKFSKQIAHFPHAYDRLDRLVRMPTGKSILWRSVHTPGGYQLFEYLTTAPGGNEMGRMLMNGSAGRDFNKPTGRIYTTSGLIAELRPRWEESWNGIRDIQARALDLNPNRIRQP